MSFAYTASRDLASTSASTPHSEFSGQTYDLRFQPSEIFESKTTEGQSDGMAAKSNSEVCIYEVPHGLKEGNENACKPQVVVAESEFLSTVMRELSEVAKSEESLLSNTELCIYEVPHGLKEGKENACKPRVVVAESEFLSTVMRELSEVAKSEESLRSNSEICIYQVPHGLKEGNENACNPRVVDLALYCRSEEHLAIQDTDKWRAFNKALQTKRGKKPGSVDANNQGNDLKSYLDALKNLEERARKCYEKSRPCDGKEPIPILEGLGLIKRMKLNVSFVIEMLTGASYGFENIGYRKDDFVFSKSMFNSIQEDMVKMENQIPLFVIDAVVGFHLGKQNHEGGTAPLIPKFETNSSVHERDLIGLITQFFNSLMPRPTEQTNATPTAQSDHERYLVGLITHFFNSLMPRPTEQTNATLTEQSNDVRASFHFLDVYRRYLKSGLQDNDSTEDGPLPKRRMQLIPCATLLRDAGFTLKTIKTDCFLDIKFKKKTLRIPHLKIHDGTKPLFLNLIAFEQRHPGCSRTFTSYVCFIDNLIRSTEDVAFLRCCGIIENNIGKDDEVLKLLHSLLQDVVFDPESCYLKKLSEEVRQHYNSWWSALRAWLIQYSKTNPLFIIPWVVGIVGLLLGFTNFFYGAFGHHAKATNAR